MYYVFPVGKKQDGPKKGITAPILKPTDHQKPYTFFWPNDG